jgi:hypothetical protein
MKLQRFCNFVKTNKAMKQDQHQMINELESMVENCRRQVAAFREVDVNVLQYKASPGSWSVLECAEHLNMYGDFYLPEMEKSLLSAKPAGGREFKSGLLGGYFAKLMKVGADGKMTKMKSPADKNPASSELTAVVLDRLIKQLDMLLVLLERARGVDLRRAKTPITLSKWVRLSLGDTFRFNVFHIERHVMQAGRAMAMAEKSVPVRAVAGG